MSDVQMFWSSCAECEKFLSQRRSGAVLMGSRHEECQTDKQGLYLRKRIRYHISSYKTLSHSMYGAVYNTLPFFPQNVTVQFSGRRVPVLIKWVSQRHESHHYHHQHRHCHHQSLNYKGRWGTIDDFATNFLHFSLFSTALWDLPISRPVHSPVSYTHLTLPTTRMV